jgi:hypothetical protein
MQRGDLAFAENDLGWVVKGKVSHDVLGLDARWMRRSMSMMSCHPPLFNGWA